jgi:hypothetical protein
MEEGRPRSRAALGRFDHAPITTEINPPIDRHPAIQPGYTERPSSGPAHEVVFVSRRGLRRRLSTDAPGFSPSRPGIHCY